VTSAKPWPVKIRLPTRYLETGKEMHCAAKLIPKKTAPLSDFIIGDKERRVK
jgi:hypothetical protein